ncbi:MAG: hypothetical protein HOO91_06125 [Bacteroidales bacterium]|nr:hypothetical protein [Bacteroidales bacterium]
MKKFLENKFAMIGTVIALLKQNVALWTSSTVFKVAVTDLESVKADIDNVRNGAEQKTNGSTTTKGAHREELENKVYEVISVVYAMATRTGNKNLQADMKHSLSDLQGMRDGRLVALSAHVISIIRENATALKDYSVTEESATMLDSLCSSFSSRLSTPRVVVSERKAANESLDDLFGKADDILQNVIDKLMVPYKTSKPDFYSAYKSARKIVNYGTRHEKEETKKEEEVEK